MHQLLHHTLHAPTHHTTVQHMHVMAVVTWQLLQLWLVRTCVSVAGTLLPVRPPPTVLQAP
jgi:hypothetical protein